MNFKDIIHLDKKDRAITNTEVVYVIRLVTDMVNVGMMELGPEYSLFVKSLLDTKERFVRYAEERCIEERVYTRGTNG